MLTEMLVYADLHGLTMMEERMEFVRFMRSMDSVYLRHVANKDAVSNV